MYAWRLTPTDPTPKGKREKPSLRELEQQIRRDIEDGIDSTGKKMTLCQLYAKQNAQRANVKKSTQKQREQLMRLLKEDKLGARSIDTIKPSDAKEWALRMDNPLPHITPHTLRHTFCTRLASKNMNPKDLQYIMGHSNISITMNWYAHASIDTAKSEVQRLIA